MVDMDEDKEGVYEFGDAKENVVYVGGTGEIKTRLKRHLKTKDQCIKTNAKKYRIEYTKNYKKREQELYDEHVNIYGIPPKCNDSRPPGK